MPASTSIYGITYPCGDDTIDPQALATFAITMDAALTRSQLELAETAQRPNAQLLSQAPQLIPFDTPTLLTNYTTEVYDNDNMATPGDDKLVINTPGIYMVSGQIHIGLPWTLFYGLIVILTANGVEIGRHRSRMLPSADSTNVWVTLPARLLAGDQVQMQALWAGTGGPATVTTRQLSASFVTTL